MLLIARCAALGGVALTIACAPALAAPLNLLPDVDVGMRFVVDEGTKGVFGPDHFYYTKGIAVTYDGAQRTVLAGFLQLGINTVAPGNKPGTKIAEIATICLEIYAALQSFDNPYTLRAVTDSDALTDPLAEAMKAGLLGELWHENFDRIAGMGNADQRSIEAAAFQIAAWEITNDDGLNLDTGRLRVTQATSVRSAADRMLTAVKDPGGHQDHLLALVDKPNGTNRQDLVVRVAVSEPGSIFLIAAGLFAIVMVAVTRSSPQKQASRGSTAARDDELAELPDRAGTA